MKGDETEDDAASALPVGDLRHHHAVAMTTGRKSSTVTATTSVTVVNAASVARGIAPAAQKTGTGT